MENEFSEICRRVKNMEEIYLKMAASARKDDPESSFRYFRESELFRKAAEEIRRLEPTEPEIEGGGSTWWHVCGECHTTVDTADRFCRQCGRPLEWGKSTATSEDAQD